MIKWWQWEIVQRHWYRKFKRQDRKAFKRECEQIRWHVIMGCNTPFDP